MAESEAVLNARASGRSLAVFDIDGTLTDTNAIDGEAFAAAVCAHLGLPSISTNWSRFPRVTDSAIFDTLCRDHLGHGAEAHDVTRVQEQLLAHFARAPRDAFAPIAGARELLQALRGRDDWTVALATGAWACSARYKLKAAGLDDDDWPLASADDALDRATIVRTAIARAGGPFDRVVLLGDGAWDRSTARELALPFIPIGLRLAGALPDFHDLDTVFAALLSDRID